MDNFDLRKYLAEGKLNEVVITKDMRIHMSKDPLTLQQQTYEQEGGIKPNGFWYGFGKEWISWAKSNMPDWAGKYIYTVEVPNNVLKITSYDELLQFNEEYKANQFQIDWKRVVSKFDGIEIVPYQQKAKMNIDLIWYYGWDIASGCIWNLQNLKLNLISS